MKHYWYPSDDISSTYEIDFETLAKIGYQGVIFDVDNTLVPHGAPADARAKELFAWLNDLGFQSILLSNNKEPRVKSFCQDVNATGYLFKAGKPNPQNYIKAMEQMGTNRETTLFVGDQIFTDIWGANLAGMTNVLVKPILPWKEEIQIILKRIPEKLIIVTYGLCKKLSKKSKSFVVPKKSKNK